MVPGMLTPNGLAANPNTNRIYITSRDNDQLFVMEGQFNDVIAQVQTGDQPFGVAVNPVTNKVYVAAFGDGQLTVVNGLSNQVIKALYLGPGLTYVGVNTATNRVYVVSHAMNALFILDGIADTVLDIRGTGGGGAFGLAVNQALNRVYVSHRDTQDIVTMDGAGNQVPGQRIRLATPGGVPYALGLNPNTGKLYAMVGPASNVDRAEIYQTAASGLSYLGTVLVGAGGSNGGGGIAVNTTTNRVYVTNSQANTVSIINGITNLLMGSVAVGEDPFGIVANPATNLIYVGNRASNYLSLMSDDF